MAAGGEIKDECNRLPPTIKEIKSISRLENQQSIQDVRGKMQGGKRINLISKIFRILNSLGDENKLLCHRKKAES